MVSLAGQGRAVSLSIPFCVRLVDWEVLNYIRGRAYSVRAFDVATGFFGIGALLALDGQLQKLERLRILMGDEVAEGTEKATLLVDRTIL